MLDLALGFLKDELSSYITARTASTTVSVKLARLLDDTGNILTLDESIRINLINIEEERTVKEHLPEYAYVNGRQVKLEPELRLNLYMLVAANFTQYNVGLTYLSHAITFFQAHPVFTQDKYPRLNPGIEKLIVELQSLNYEQMNEIWAYVGAKQMPCVVYKVRMVILQDVEPSAVQPPITSIDTTIESLS